jgi:hypothetical protein
MSNLNKQDIFSNHVIKMKPKIYATGNETLKGEFNISYYIFEKDKTFLDWLSKLLVEVFEIQDREEQAKFIIKRKDTEEGDWIEDKIFIKEISKMIDLHEEYENKGERVDVFYGKNRVYVTLRKSRKVRKKFADFVRKTKDWIKIKQIQDVPVYVKKANKEKFN